MRNVLRVYCGGLLLCACGARSEIAGGFFDASLDLDATTSDVVLHQDGSPFGGDAAGVDAGACAAAVTNIGCTKDCESCKFDVEWTCGDTKYRIGGYCDPASLFPDAAFLEGVCVENGTQTSSFKEPAATCDCNDASALVTIVQEKCTHQ